MNRNSGICLLFLLSASLPARADGNGTPVPSAYQDVMRAQYAARAVSPAGAAGRSTAHL